MKLKTFLSMIFILLFLSGQGFAEGSKFDRFANDAEVAAQTRDDVGLTPANIPYIKAAEANATIKDTLTMKNGTDIHKIKAVDEPGLGGRLTIGLDETARTMIICDVGDVDTDMGLSAKINPTLSIFRADGGISTWIDCQGIFLNGGSRGYISTEGSNQLKFQTNGNFIFKNTDDRSAGNGVEFGSLANIELTDTNAEQSWLYVEPKINQSATAAYNGLKIKVTETATGNATTGDGGGTNNLILAGTSVDPDMFKVDNVGRICVAESSDPTALADHVFFYGKNVTGTTEAFAADAAANAAQLTAHNDSLFDPDPNELYPWMPYYKNSALGIEAGFDMSRALRDLQAVTGTDYIHYRNVSKTVDLEKVYKEQWIKNYIESNAQKVEVLKIQALEIIQTDRPKIYEVEVSYQLCDENGTCANKIKIVKQRKKIGETITGYEFVDGEVKPKVKIIWETEIVDKFQIKKGIHFDKSNGKFYLVVKPTSIEAAVAAETGFCFNPPKWLNGRLTKVSLYKKEK